MSNTNQQKITSLAIFIFLLSTVFYCYEFFIQVAPSVMTSELMRDFSADATLIGLLSGFFFYSYTVCQIPAGLLLDKYGSRIMLTIVIAICAIGALLFAFAPNIAIASLARLLMGASSAFAFTGTLYIITRWFPAWSFALFAGVAQMMSSLGAIAGNAPLANMINHIGWRHSMLILAIVGFALAILVYSFVRNQPANYNHKAQEQFGMLKSLKIVLGKKQTWYVAIYSFCIWATIVAFSALWGVPFLKTNYHLSNIAAAKIISITWIGIAIGSPVAGWISDKIKRRNLPLASLALLGCISITCVIFIPHLSINTLYLLLFLVGFAAGGQTLIFGVVKDINPINVTGAANGFNNMVVVSGGALFQPLIGKLLDVNWTGIMNSSGVKTYDLHAYHVAFIALPICCFIAFIVSTFFIKETHCQNTA
jgi:MFS family permease